MSAIPTAIRDKVWARQNRQCCRCGGRGYEIHHRKRRREGGHSLGNCIGLCGTCHRWAHANPDKAKEQGYITGISVDDPSTVPIQTFMGLVLFDDGGGIHFING